VCAYRGLVFLGAPRSRARGARVASGRHRLSPWPLPRAGAAHTRLTRRVHFLRRRRAEVRLWGVAAGVALPAPPRSSSAFPVAPVWPTWLLPHAAPAGNQRRLAVRTGAMNPPPLPAGAVHEVPAHPTPPPAKRRAVAVSPIPPEGGTAGATPGEAALWAELSRVQATAASLTEEAAAIRSERSQLAKELVAAREEREQFRAIAGQVKALEATVGMQASRIEWLMAVVDRLRAGASDDGGGAGEEGENGLYDRDEDAAMDEEEDDGEGEVDDEDDGGGEEDDEGGEDDEDDEDDGAGAGVGGEPGYEDDVEGGFEDDGDGEGGFEEEDDKDVGLDENDHALPDGPAPGRLGDGGMDGPAPGDDGRDGDDGGDDDDGEDEAGDEEDDFEDVDDDDQGGEDDEDDDEGGPE